jgi:hypothetical protein
LLSKRGLWLFLLRHRLAAALDGALPAAGYYKLGAALGAAIPLADLIGHRCTAFLELSDRAGQNLHNLRYYSAIEGHCQQCKQMIEC